MMSNMKVSEVEMVREEISQSHDLLQVNIEEVIDNQINQKIKLKTFTNNQKKMEELGISGLLFISVTVIVVIVYNFTKVAWRERLRLVTFENTIYEFPNLNNQIKAERLIKFVQARSCLYGDLSPYRCAILNNKFYIYHDDAYFDHPRLRTLNDTFNRILKTNQLPDTYFLIFPFDFIPYSYNNFVKTDHCSKMPMFMFNKNVQSTLESNKFLFPDPYILDNWQDSIDEVKKASMEYRWDEKIPKLFFVGAPSGFGPPIISFTILAKYYHRGALVQMSLQNPDILYAKINRILDYYLAKQLFVRSKFNQQIFAPKTSIAEHVRYKYLISVDGAASPWKRPCFTLFSNSVLFKTDSKNIQWFYDKLVPGQNYVKIKEDLSNLFSERERLQQDPIKAIEITKKANQLSQKFLTSEAIDSFIVDSIKKYANIQELSLTEEEKMQIEKGQDIQVVLVKKYQKVDQKVQVNKIQ